MSLPPITFATDTELRDAAFAEKLARRRTRLLRWSLPVVILAALVALKLLSAVGLNLIGTASYDRANYPPPRRGTRTPSSSTSSSRGRRITTRGRPTTRREVLHCGQRLEIALEKVPKNPEDQPRGPEECAVRVNYSSPWKAPRMRPCPSATRKWREYYTQALDMLADCADSGEGGDTAEDAQERQEQGQQEAQDEQDPQGQEPDGGTGEDPDSGEPDSPDSGDPEQPEETQEPEDPQQEELEDRNQRANEEDGEGDEEERAGVGDGSGENW